MKCPHCGGEHTQRQEVIYHSGTQQYSATARGVVGGIVGVQGVTQSGLAQGAAPPAKRGLLGPVLAVGFGVSLTKVQQELGWGVALLAACVLVARWFYNRFSWPDSYRIWLRSWRCLQCGHLFFEPGAFEGSSSSGLGGLPMLALLAALSAGAYFTRDSWRPYFDSSVKQTAGRPSPAVAKPSEPIRVEQLANRGAASVAAIPGGDVIVDSLPLYERDDRTAPVIEVLARGTQVQFSALRPSLMDTLQLRPQKSLIRVVSPTGHVGWVEATGIRHGSASASP